MNGLKFNISFIIALFISLFTLGIGFLLHELAHKFVAQRYGCFAEFRSFDGVEITASRKATMKIDSGGAATDLHLTYTIQIMEGTHQVLSRTETYHDSYDTYFKGFDLDNFNYADFKETKQTVRNLDSATSQKGLLRTFFDTLDKNFIV